MTEWQECNREVRALAADVLSIDPVGLDDSVPLVDYGLDSLRAMALVVALEHRFEVTIDDDELQWLHTTAEITDFVVGRT